MYLKNTAGQFFCFQMNKTTDGTALTGATVSVRRCIDGTFAAATGTVTEDTGVGSSAGMYKFAMSQADTNGNNISFAMSATSGISVVVNIITDGGTPAVNSTKVGGTTQTGRDLGASVNVGAINGVTLVGNGNTQPIGAS